MNILKHLDLYTIFWEIRKNQLEEYPTVESYKDFLDSVEEPDSYVDEMYRMLNDEKYLKELELQDPDEYSLSDIYDGEYLTIELFIGGNDANESTNYNEWGYGYEFKINLEYDLFEGYQFNNYS